MVGAILAVGTALGNDAEEQGLPPQMRSARVQVTPPR
jgi:hypothetical protein